MKKLLILFLLIPFLLQAGEKRSTEWNKVRKEHLRLNSVCALCGSSKDLQVHHIKPFHIEPALELEPSNLITLCQSKYWGFNCHLLIGHGGNFRYENADLMEDIEHLKEIVEKTQCQKEGCMVNDEFTQYVKEMKQRVKEYNCRQYGKCGKGRK